MNRKEKKDQTNNVIQIKIKNNLLNKIYYYFFNKKLSSEIFKFKYIYIFNYYIRKMELDQVK